jgi:hypothetical protein
MKRPLAAGGGDGMEGSCECPEYSGVGREEKSCKPCGLEDKDRDGMIKRILMLARIGHG